MKQDKKDYGLTTQRAVGRILEREDNIYNKETIRNVIKMYMEECINQLMQGETVSFEGIGTFKAGIVNPPGSYGIPNMNENEPLPYVKMKFRTKTRLKDMLKAKLNKNLKKGIKSLKEEAECLDE